MAISEKEVTKYMISDAGSAESLEAAKKVVQG
jgi:hypothetical protein